jgi:hypothetical protein
MKKPFVLEPISCVKRCNYCPASQLSTRKELKILLEKDRAG